MTKANFHVVDEGDTPMGALKEAAEKYPDAEAVMVLVLLKDGGQALIGSRASMYQKVWLVQFAQAWVNRWFD